MQQYIVNTNNLLPRQIAYVIIISLLSLLYHFYLLQNSSSRLCCRGLPSTDLKSKFSADSTCSKVDSIVSRYFSVSISSGFASITGLTPSPFFTLTYEMTSPALIPCPLLASTSILAALIC